MINELFSFSAPCPKYKEQVVSLNNIGKWYRYNKSKIMNEYKTILKTWHIPEVEEKLEKAYFSFELKRHNKRVLDSDNLGFIIKWTIDAVKEEEWLLDDNKITYNVIPAIVDRTLKETIITVRMFKKKEDYILYLQENLT